MSPLPHFTWHKINKNKNLKYDSKNINCSIYTGTRWYQDNKCNKWTIISMLCRCTQKHGSSLQQFVKVDVHRNMAHLYNNSWRSMYTETCLISTTIREGRCTQKHALSYAIDKYSETNVSPSTLSLRLNSSQKSLKPASRIVVEMSHVSVYNFQKKNPSGIALLRTYHLVKLANLCRGIKY
jgi:hypothetical protein